MSKIQSKQVKKILTGAIKITGVSVTSSNSSVIVTSSITSALAVAGDGGTSVPLQVSSSVTIPGVVTASPINRVDIWDNVSKDKFQTTGGREIFGRLTQSVGVYTLSFFYLDISGTELAYTFLTNVSIDFDFNYRFEFHQAPADIIVSQLTRNVTQDAKNAAGITIIELLSVTALNTVSSLSNTTSDTNTVKLYVNGKMEDALGGSPNFTITAGTNITWSSVNALYSLDTTDRVVAEYFI